MPPLAKHALREILRALRDGFAARDVRLGFALPEGRKKRRIWAMPPVRACAVQFLRCRLCRPSQSTRFAKYWAPYATLRRSRC